MAVGQVSAAGGAGNTSLEAAHRALLQDKAVQFDLPPYQEPEPPGWLQPLLDFLQWLAPAGPYLFWGGLALVALLILYWVLRDFLGLTIRLPWHKDKADAQEDAWLPDEVAARGLLAEAEALAARGHHEAAVHLLLRRSVEEIATRLPDFLVPSLTARDIAAAPSVPERARDAFGAMAVIVERALFARRPVGEPGWQEARSAYERFAFAQSWRRE